MGNMIPSDRAQPVDKDRNKDSEKQIWQAIREKVRAGLSTFFLIFSVTMFIATIAWVVVAAIWWPAENSRYNRNTIEIDDNRHLEIWGPQVVPGDEDFVEIRFSLRQVNIPPEAISLKMTIPPEFNVVAPKNQKNSQTIKLDFGGALEEEIKTIRIANAHIVNGPGAKAIRIAILQKSPVKEEEELGHFTLAPEGMLRAVLLRYGGSGNDVPFIPLTTVFIAVAGFAYQQFERREQKSEKERQKQKESAESSMQNIREALRNGKIETAQPTLDGLLQDDARAHLQESDLQIARSLLEIGRGNFENASTSFFVEWPEESAGVLRYAAENNLTDRNKLDELLRGFPLDNLKDENARDALTSIKGVVGVAVPVQAREPRYPPKLNFVKFNPLLERFEDNPFPFENAENDKFYLFAENEAMFWSAHPLAGALKSARGATLVTGEAGSGKTAFALALGEYRHVLDQKDIFSCRLRGTPSLEEIQHALALRLLDFVERLPSFLILLGDERRNLLAQTLNARFGRNTVAGKLEYASNPTRWEWLKKATSNETKRRVWEAETRAHFRLLINSVAAPAPYVLSDWQWMFAFMTCVRSFEFKKNVYIVIDTADDFNRNWYNDVILANQHRWAEINLHTITFRLPDTNRKGKKTFSGIESFVLQWDEKQLQDMAEWRWGSVYEKRRGGLASLFAPNAYEALIKASQNNPRCFIRLWNAMVKSKQKTPFTVKDVGRAKEQTSCA